MVQDGLKTIAYARVSSHDQKEDLIRQVAVLESYCAKKGFEYEVIQDLGSGMNYYVFHLTTKRKTLYVKLLSLNPTVPRKGLNMK